MEKIDVAGGPIDLGPQPPRPIREFTRSHAAEEIEVFLGGSIAPGTIASRLGQGAAGDAHLLLRLVVDISLADSDQVLGPLVELLEVIGRMVEMCSPVEAEPAHVALDGVDIFLLLFRRIGVVEAQMAAATELLCDAEIKGDRLSVADMQIAVGLRRKAGHHRGVAFGSEIRFDDIANEIAPRLRHHRSSFRHATSHCGCAGAYVPNPLARAKTVEPRNL